MLLSQKDKIIQKRAIQKDPRDQEDGALRECMQSEWLLLMMC